MSGAKALVEYLRAEGITHIFGLPGTQVLTFMDVLRENPDIRFILTRHEQGAAYMAVGMGRALRRPGVCLSTVGPGATNLLTAVAAAFKGNTPLIAIAGKQERGQQEKDGLQELDQVGMFRPVTKWSYMVSNAEKIPETMRRAFRTAMSGGGWPVHVDIPRDLLSQEIEAEVQQPASYRAEDRPFCPPDQVRRAVGLLKEAKAPVFLLSRQVQDDGAVKLLQQVAERYHVPVATSCINLDSFPSTHPMSLGPIGRSGWPIANRMVREADLLISLGRFDPFSTAMNNDIVSANSKILHVCRNPEHLGVVYPLELGIVGTTDSFLSQLLEMGGQDIRGNPAHMESIRSDWEATRANLAAPAGGPVKVQHLVRTLRRVLDKNAIAVIEGGNFSGHFYTHWDCYEPGTVFFPDNIGAIGSSLPMALGVKMARPDRQVVSLSGDGGFMMNMAELETAVREKINIVAIVLNDFGLGNNRGYLKANYGSRFFAESYSNPDFGKLMELFGGWGRQIRHCNEVEGALKAALAAGKPALIDVLIDPEDLATVTMKR